MYINNIRALATLYKIKKDLQYLKNSKQNNDEDDYDEILKQLMENNDD
ncbi:MAG: hypothetical protein LBH40_04160 [Alphaproteobacteria bacterium]|nr:hypothetical protein [Alphaproteobacteria bacterium]